VGIFFSLSLGEARIMIKLPWIPFYVAVSPNPPHLAVTANQNGTLTLFDFGEL
jgi:hypothetical protein